MSDADYIQKMIGKLSNDDWFMLRDLAEDRGITIAEMLEALIREEFERLRDLGKIEDSDDIDDNPY